MYRVFVISALFVVSAANTCTSSLDCPTLPSSFGVTKEECEREGCCFSEDYAVCLEPNSPVVIDGGNYDACAGNPCAGNKKGKTFCVLFGNTKGYKCRQDPCVKNPCKHGGMCKMEVNGFSCTCPNDYIGKRCQKQIKGNKADPCFDGFGPCHKKGTKECKVEIYQGHYYRCVCNEGFKGRKCKRR